MVSAPGVSGVSAQLPGQVGVLNVSHCIWEGVWPQNQLLGGTGVSNVSEELSTSSWSTTTTHVPVWNPYEVRCQKYK